MILTLMKNEGIENETSEERINQPVIEIQPHQNLLMNKELLKMTFRFIIFVMVENYNSLQYSILKMCIVISYDYRFSR